MIREITGYTGVYAIDIPLPGNPLRNLNCYAVLSGGEALLIDTGFNRPECSEALVAGIESLGIDLTRSSLFLTHLHSDHTGLAPYLADCGIRDIFMSKTDYDILYGNVAGNRWDSVDEMFRREGFTDAQIADLKTSNPAREYEPSPMFEARFINDGDTISVGDRRLACFATPGHTPGLMCLYDDADKVLFSADHVLFDITPNIMSWMGHADSLGDYLNSLVRTRQREIRMALPAHRWVSGDVYTRINFIIAHHLQRLKETVSALSMYPGGNCIDIAAALKWSMRGKTWDEFPLAQRWFAVGETRAHLDYLIRRNLALQGIAGSVNSYWLCGDADAVCGKLDDIWAADYGCIARNSTLQ